MKLSDQFWREAVQFAAESLDGPMASGCQEVSMAAKRYKETWDVRGIMTA